MSKQSIYTFRSLKETYEAPITMSYSNWADYVGGGYNTSLGGAVIPGGTSLGGAIINGHPRQNFETASFPVSPDSLAGTPGEDHVGYQEPNQAFATNLTDEEDKERLAKFLEENKYYAEEEEEEGVNNENVETD